jgi:quercetin dioxygenase-like cupin family protein
MTDGRHHLKFDEAEWESPIPGMRQKVLRRDGLRVRLVEYTGEMEPHWCERGHAGYIIEGMLETEFDDGIEILTAGDGVLIPEGAEHRHRARVLTGLVRALFVERDPPAQ